MASLFHSLFPPSNHLSPAASQVEKYYSGWVHLRDRELCEAMSSCSCPADRRERDGRGTLSLSHTHTHTLACLKLAYNPGTCCLEQASWSCFLRHCITYPSLHVPQRAGECMWGREREREREKKGACSGGENVFKCVCFQEISDKDLLYCVTLHWSQCNLR